MLAWKARTCAHQRPGLLPALLRGEEGEVHRPDRDHAVEPEAVLPGLAPGGPALPVVIEGDHPREGVGAQVVLPALAARVGALALEVGASQIVFVRDGSGRARGRARRRVGEGLPCDENSRVCACTRGGLLPPLRFREGIGVPGLFRKASSLVAAQVRAS